MQNLRAKEAAKFLCISMSKLMKLCHKRQIKYYKVGRVNVFREEDLVEYMESNRVLTIEELQEHAENQLFNLKPSIVRSNGYTK